MLHECFSAIISPFVTSLKKFDFLIPVSLLFSGKLFFIKQMFGNLLGLILV